MSVWQLFAIPMEVVCGLIHAALAFMFANVDGTMALHLASVSAIICSEFPDSEIWKCVRMYLLGHMGGPLVDHEGTSQ